MPTEHAIEGVVPDEVEVAPNDRRIVIGRAASFGTFGGLLKKSKKTR